MPAVCAKTSANSEPSINGKAAQGLRQDCCAFSNAAVWRSPGSQGSERLFLPQGTFLAWARPCTPPVPAARWEGGGGSQGNAGSPLCWSWSGCRRRLGGSGRTTICLLLVGPKVSSKGSLGAFDPSRLPGTPGGAFPATNPGLSGAGEGGSMGRHRLAETGSCQEFEPAKARSGVTIAVHAKADCGRSRL